MHTCVVRGNRQTACPVAVFLWCLSRSHKIQIKSFPKVHLSGRCDTPSNVNLPKVELTQWTKKIPLYHCRNTKNKCLQAEILCNTCCIPRFLRHFWINQYCEIRWFFKLDVHNVFFGDRLLYNATRVNFLPARNTWPSSQAPTRLTFEKRFASWSFLLPGILENGADIKNGWHAMRQLVGPQISVDVLWAILICGWTY